MAKIAVIVVNYGTADLSIAAVESVLSRTHADHQVTVHLVENASPGEDARLLKSHAAEAGWGDRVQLYLAAENCGFGPGNNLVLNQLEQAGVKVDYVMFLNPDAEVKDGTITTLAAFLGEHPNVGFAGAHSHIPGDPTPMVSAFRFPSLASVFSHATNFGPVSRLFRRTQVALEADGPTRRVGWVAGAGVMARFDMLCDLKHFDPDYFLYYEEVDLMLRAARAGWETWHVRDAVIMHWEGAATDVRSGESTRRRRPAYWYDSWRMYFHKNHGRGYTLVATILWILGSGTDICISRLRGREPAAPLNVFRDISAHIIRPILTKGPGRV